MAFGSTKTASYNYDDNGYPIHNAGRDISWAPFNKAKSLTQGALRFDYRYGPDRERQLKTVRENNRLTHSTRYFGSYEERRDAGGKVEKRYHIRAGGQIVAQLVIDDAHPLGQERYLHRDALGSVVLITDNQGQSIAEPGYSPFGQRRNLQALRNLNSHLGFGAVDIAALTGKCGFTGHEHIDEMGLIDMTKWPGAILNSPAGPEGEGKDCPSNGRIYDPAIGRFLSADPFVQLPKSTQGLNRYAYVQNNPLKYTDPSGYFLKSLFKSISRFINSYGSAIILAVVTGGIGYAVGAVHGAFWGGFAAGFGGTLMAGGNLRNAVSGGLFGGVSAHAASWVKGLKGVGDFGKSMMHGMAQGSLAIMRGGRFKESFLDAIASHGMTMLAESQKRLPAISERSGSAIALRTAFATVSGGIATELGGGKFRNGAVTAAFVHLFNADRYGHQLDKAGEERPGDGFVIGPKGYWQNQTGAEVELIHGPDAQMSMAPVPSNNPSCNALCVSIATTESFVTGSSISDSLSSVADVLMQHPNHGVSAAGFAIRRFVLPAKVYNTAVQVESIKKYCAELCSLDPFEYQQRFGAR